jgi:hypothetical protein
MVQVGYLAIDERGCLKYAPAGPSQPRSNPNLVIILIDAENDH